MVTDPPGKGLPTRKALRLRGYDYSLPAAYLVTICAAGRAALFGSIADGELVPTALGRLVEDDIRALPDHYPGYLLVDQWVVMPNHLHLLLFFVRPLLKRGEGHSLVLPVVDPPNLSNVVRHLKAGITRKGRVSRIIDPGQPVFQSHFHDHVIRHERALERVQEYILNNPRQWELDRENPGRTGNHGFYRWLEAYCVKSAAS